jgi:hypothetical protein
MTVNPAVITLRTGARGPVGETGATGATGPAGVDGADGEAGEAGVFAHGTVSAGTESFDRGDGIVHTVTVGGAFTVSTIGWPASTIYGELLLQITNGGAFTITWPGAVVWLTDNGLAPELQSSGTDFIVLTSIDNGTTIYGFAAGGGLALDDGDKGDISVTGGGTTWTIDSGVITAYGRTLTAANNASSAAEILSLGTSDAVVFGSVQINSTSTDTVLRRSTTNIISMAGVPVLSGGIVVEATTARTLSLTDAAKVIEFTNSSASICTVPGSASVAFPDGTFVNITRKGAGALSLTTGTGVTLLSKSSARILTGQYSMATLYKSSADSWILGGDVSTV